MWCVLHRQIGARALGGEFHSGVTSISSQGDPDLIAGGRTDRVFAAFKLHFDASTRGELFFGHVGRILRPIIASFDLTATHSGRRTEGSRDSQYDIHSGLHLPPNW